MSFTIDLPATLWSSGTFTICDHPLGNSDKFHPSLSGNPDVSDLSWHENLIVMNQRMGIMGESKSGIMRHVVISLGFREKNTGLA